MYVWAHKFYKMYFKEKLIFFDHKKKIPLLFLQKSFKYIRGNTLSFLAD